MASIAEKVKDIIVDKLGVDAGEQALRIIITKNDSLNGCPSSFIEIF